jgi:3'-5' exoribonuclease 1
MYEKRLRNLSFKMTKVLRHELSAFKHKMGTYVAADEMVRRPEFQGYTTDDIHQVACTSQCNGVPRYLVYCDFSEMQPRAFVAINQDVTLVVWSPTVNVEKWRRRQQPQLFDYLCIVDFECTCDEGVQPSPQEIIEFPVLLLDCQTGRVEAEFHSFVRPTIYPKLSTFCTQLTGIQQATVDQAPSLASTLMQFDTWLQQRVEPSKSIAFVTDGRCDVFDFLYPECEQLAIPVQVMYPYWDCVVNIRETFSSHYQCRPSTISGMLEALGMTFQGRKHSGLDDARNITQIAKELLQHGAVFQRNCFEHMPRFQLQ